MQTILFSHPSCIEHDPGAHHPERPDRLHAILRALEAEEFALLQHMEAPKATFAQIERVHAPFYVENILETIPREGRVHLDPDTAVSPGSGEAALRAAGAACAAVDSVLSGDARNVFCAVRPPGHHAEHETAMGFCLFNNVAIAAEHARAAHGLKRVAVVDFDVHHGNGTQSMFEKDGNLFYASSHQSPAYPGTGSWMETGVDHNIVNVELEPGSGSSAFRAAYDDVILPKLRNFAPEMVLISAGFDAHARDPLAQLQVTTEDFGWVSERILSVANDCCAGRVASMLEGGYDLDSLADSVAAHVRALMTV
ncbi:MAG: histone deacetylase family protein [Rhodospirillales bacterium]|nr:histone deacetylase family protein [Rhodospirillales bacterium]MCW8952692.1 histone deacetylase family protein [Rhodospirillales bacterium]MCW8970169.1 histone deacetylase family protein [Rhodospirillales bacterium]MCW9001483.1 histone deacetylase family protein [Rhodospirillales bacterium]